MISLFEQMVSAGDVEVSRLSSIRVKLHVPCQWTCHFCHMEGNHGSSSIQNAEQLRQALLQFRLAFGLTEVHFTGGEPSIHPRIVEYIALAKSLGFSPKMTTNGQAGPDHYLKMAKAGLEEINVSIHTLNGDSLAQLMAPPRSSVWGQQAVDAQIRLIRELKSTLKIKVNTVVGHDVSHALAIWQFVKTEGLSWRIMDNLEDSEASFQSMKTLIEKMGAVPKTALLVRGTSSCGILMQCPDGLRFKVKLIRPYRLPLMCQSCPVDANGKCQEFAYGPRIEANGNILMVRSCLHRSTEDLVQGVESYFAHPFSQELASEIEVR